MTKWGGLAHWEYDALRLGVDGHGTWLGCPAGTLIARPGARFRSSQDQLTLVPTAEAWVASFFAPGGRSPCEVYVDISTTAQWDDAVVTAVDLDLDVIRGWRGRVWVEDEDEFLAHRGSLGYPDDVVRSAWSSCDAVRKALTDRSAPYDGTTAARWFAALTNAR